MSMDTILYAIGVWCAIYWFVRIVYAIISYFSDSFGERKEDEKE